MNADFVSAVNRQRRFNEVQIHSWFEQRGIPRINLGSGRHDLIYVMTDPVREKLYEQSGGRLIHSVYLQDALIEPKSGEQLRAYNAIITPIEFQESGLPVPLVTHKQSFPCYILENRNVYSPDAFPLIMPRSDSPLLLQNA